MASYARRKLWEAELLAAKIAEVLYGSGVGGGGPMMGRYRTIPSNALMHHIGIPGF